MSLRIGDPSPYGPSPFAMANAPKAPDPEKPAGGLCCCQKKALAVLALVLLVWWGAGCASVTQSLRTTTTTADGTVEERETRNRGVAFWDARQTVERIRASNGKTHSVGVSGLEGAAESTNTVAALDRILAILQTVK